MTDAFGDYEPEDAWDPGDPPELLLDNLRRRVLLLYIARTLPPLDTLELVALAVIVARARDDLTPRDTTRIADLFDDIAYLAAGRS
jgi:hypothetical protein